MTWLFLLLDSIPKRLFLSIKTTCFPFILDDLSSDLVTERPITPDPITNVSTLCAIFNRLADPGMSEELGKKMQSSNNF